jgi:hypothetical protein
MASRARVRLPHPLLVAVLGVAVGLGFGYLAVDSYVGHRALDERGRAATARVVDVRERAWPRNPRLTVEFTTADGRTTQARVHGDRNGAAREGREVRVRYDPRDPTNVALAGDDARGHLLVGALAAILLIGSPAVAWFLIRPARRALADNPGLAERVAEIQAREDAERR